MEHVCDWKIGSVFSRDSFALDSYFGSFFLLFQTITSMSFGTKNENGSLLLARKLDLLLGIVVSCSA